ncbi:MAG: hypothetical protein IJU79_04955, partial [Desulfovibrionaceae bacterium]|nr:hypothetical protein [Desulfovibrionaceae bacterium]
ILLQNICEKKYNESLLAFIDTLNSNKQHLLWTRSNKDFDLVLKMLLNDKDQSLSKDVIIQCLQRAFILSFGNNYNFNVLEKCFQLLQKINSHHYSPSSTLIQFIKKLSVTFLIYLEKNKNDNLTSYINNNLFKLGINCYAD